jgi:hypothetical protein
MIILAAREQYPGETACRTRSMPRELWDKMMSSIDLLAVCSKEFTVENASDPAEVFSPR